MKTALKIAFILCLSPLHCMASVPIGEVAFVDKKFWDLKIKSKVNGIKDAAVDVPIYETDTLQTIVGQRISFVLNDGTSLTIGPSTRITFSNWTKRDSNRRLIRKITLHFGVMHAKVTKVYSEHEPFLIENEFGIVSVRGTEFLIEAGIAGRLEHQRWLSVAERAARKTEIEVHTLEGEVFFARQFTDLQDVKKRVTLSAGQTSLLRPKLKSPQPPHLFELAQFKKYLFKALPEASSMAINKNTSNSKRAEVAVNVNQETTKSARRSIASDPVKKPTRIRREELR